MARRRGTPMALTPGLGAASIISLLRAGLRPVSLTEPYSFKALEKLYGMIGMYAVFRSGGKQYRASTGDVLRLEKIEAKEGAGVEFDQVLLVGADREVRIGSPFLDGARVSARVLRQGKTHKVPVVKFRRRQNYLRQGSHRQYFTEVEIMAIVGEGQ